jgi:hypothetical protein
MTTTAARLAAVCSQVEARTDEEIAAAEVGGVPLVLIDGAAWRRVTAVPGLPAHLLDVAETGGPAAALAVLAARKMGCW